MLTRIGTRSLDCSSILFIDKVDDKGNNLFQSTLKSFLKASLRSVHVFCWEAGTFTFLNKNSSDNVQRHVLLHDCFTDCKGWIHEKNQIHSLKDILKEALGQDEKDVDVVIDNLSVMMFTLGFGKCIEDLRCLTDKPSSIKGTVRQLLCMVHGDVLPGGPGTLPLLKHMFNMIVEVKGNEAHTTYRKSGGHVEQKKENFIISSQGDISIQEIRGVNKVKPSEEAPSLLPQDVASFRVSLNEKEREDKNRVVLPYMRTPDNSGGKVFYQPDSVDDWDDEDPDDDLDI